MSKTRTASKIARLPRIEREEISRMLNEGLSPEVALEKIQAGQAGCELTIADIRDWQQTGHQDWLEERDRLAELERVRELAEKITCSNEDDSVQEATLRVAGSQLFALLAWFNPKAFKKKVHNNLADYARVVNMLVKLSDGGLKFERYRAQVAERKANMQKQLGAESEKGGISTEFLEFMERELNLL